MDIPNLIITTGFPCSGKSVIASYLQEELGFAKLSTDSLRESVFNVKNYNTFKKEKKFEVRETIIQYLIQTAKVNCLTNGLDVIIDSTAATHQFRRQWFYTVTNQGNLKVIKSQIYLQVDENILRERNKAKGRTDSPVDNWKEFWQDPIEVPDVKLITYKNNEPSDLNLIFADLYKQYSKKIMISTYIKNSNEMFNKNS